MENYCSGNRLKIIYHIQTWSSDVKKLKTDCRTRFWNYYLTKLIGGKPIQLSWGQKLSTKVNFDIFSSFRFSKNPQIFKYFCSCAFLRISANLDFIAINLHWFKVPPVQFWSSCCIWFYIFLGYKLPTVLLGTFESWVHNIFIDFKIKIASA